VKASVIKIKLSGRIISDHHFFCPFQFSVRFFELDMTLHSMVTPANPVNDGEMQFLLMNHSTTFTKRGF
jgi:hypothetical protein